MFGRRKKPDNRGLSLIELVCSIAILSIVTATVSGAMIIATHSYERGSKETALQQEAQFTINSIENLIVDATDSVTYDPATGQLVIQNPDNTYTITYNSGAETLTYTCVGATPGSGTLAQNVKSFRAETGDFNKSRNVGIVLGMKRGASTYDTSYNITARNKPVSSSAFRMLAMFNCLDYLTLEPNQTDYEFAVNLNTSANVYNTDYRLVWVDGGTHSDIPYSITANGVTFESIPQGASGALVFRLETIQKAENGVDPLATKEVTLNFRRATGYSQGASTGYVVGSASGPYAAGAVYKVYTTVTGTHLQKDVGMPHDMGGVGNRNEYVNPYVTKWSCIEGDSRIEFVSATTNEEVNEYVFKLREDLPYSESIKIRYDALHPLGRDEAGAKTNKSGVGYATDVYGVYEITNNTVEEGSTSGILRGDDTWILINEGFDLNDVVETFLNEAIDRRLPIYTDWYAANPGKGPEDFKKDFRNDGSNFTGRMHFRFTSNEGHSSDGYGKFSLSNDQGQEAPVLQIVENNGKLLKFSNTYKFEVFYAFNYKTTKTDAYGNTSNFNAIFPFGQNKDTSPWKDDSYWQSNEVPAELLIPNVTYYSYKIDPVKFKFAQVIDTNGTDIPLTSYIENDGYGLGTATNPIPITREKDKTFSIKTGKLNNCSLDKNNGAQWFVLGNGYIAIEKQVGSNWVEINNGSELYYELDRNSADLKTREGVTEINGTPIQNKYRDVATMARFNFTVKESAPSGAVYRLVIKKYPDNSGNYATYNTTGAGGKGYVYFKLQ